jgi:hypothetical protein
VIVTPIVVGLLGVEDSPAESAGVAGQGDAGLDAGHAAGVAFGAAALEGGRELAEAPGDAHQRVAVFGQAGAADRAALADRCRLVAGGREAGGGVEVFWRREAFDRERVRGQRRRADRRDAGQAGQDLSGAVGEQLLELSVDERDVGLQRLEAIEVALESGGAQLGVRGRRQTRGCPVFCV